MSKLVSSQKERDYVKSRYDDIRSGMNMEENSFSHVHLCRRDIWEAGTGRESWT